MENYIGRLLDNRYEILEVIGTGGMAVVYKALCHRLNRLVAIKILKDDFSRDQEFRRRFHAESQAVAMLSHPNIMSIYDVSHSEDADYIVMELIEGISLKQYLEKKGRLNWRETLHFSMQIAKALDHAHSRGIIHRDIKPHNIMILKDGSIKVTDFGIARIASAQNTLTREALGSVHYISPEQAKGARVDNRSDLYSLGVVMYEMLTGRTPYDGETPVAVAIQHINGGAPLPSSFVPDVPRGIEQITMHAMASNPENRYSSAAEMLHDMEEFRKNPSITFTFGATPIVGAAGVAAAAATAPRPAAPQPSQSVPAHPGMTRTEAERYAARRNAARSADSVEARRVERERRDAEQAAARRRKNLTIAIIAASAVALVLLILLLVLLLKRPSGNKRGANGAETTISSRDSVAVDDFIGSYLADIDPKDYPDLKINVTDYDEEFSDSFEEGIIIDQTPKAGNLVRPGREVHFVISKGKDTSKMPDFTDKRGDTALSELTALGLGLKTQTEEEASETITKGYVIRTKPEAGTVLKKNQTVTLYISLGSNKMPDLQGKTEEASKEQLDAMELSLRANVEKEASETVPRGCVTRTDPAAKTELKKGQQVTIYVSFGSGKMPDLTNDTEDNAREKMKLLVESLNLQLLPQNEASDSVPSGSVIRTEPKAGTALKQGQTVTIYISLGSNKMPELANMTSDAAKKRLDDMKLNLNVVTRDEASDSVPSGSVIRSDPVAGTALTKGQTVTLYVSTGSSKIKVPNVMGKTLDEATKLLEAAHLNYRVNEVYDPSTPAGQVCSQSLLPDTEVDRGTYITIDVSKGPEPTESAGTQG